MDQGKETQLRSVRAMEGGYFYTNNYHGEMAETIIYRIQKLREVILPVATKAKAKLTFLVAVPELSKTAISIIQASPFFKLMNGQEQRWLAEHIGFVTHRSDNRIVNFLVVVCARLGSGLLSRALFKITWS